jgi:nitrile hydratase subunit beta
MNGAHDLGGMHGFGPINAEPEASEPVFHAEWEKRVFALVRATSALGCWNGDMSRHARERQHPIDYLKHTYYENWLAGLVTLLVEKSLVSPEELATGRAAACADESLRRRALQPANVPGIVTTGTPATADIEVTPRFQIGARVRARNQHPLGHTREPRYTRGHVGVIHAQRGTHILPDRSAEGERIGRPLYTVHFTAEELWGRTGNDVVYVDLWEDYLEPA